MGFPEISGLTILFHKICFAYVRLLFNFFLSFIIVRKVKRETSSFKRCLKEFPFLVETHK